LSDPRDAETLGEACANPDGTYNGLRLLSWLSKVCNPGSKGISVEEVKEIWEEVKRKKAANGLP